MKYIIMCGGQYEKWKMLRQLLLVNGEPIVARTIRLLKECGVASEDIAISGEDDAFREFGVTFLLNLSNYYSREYNDSDGDWCDAFYPTDKPACYLFGDVIFSPKAIWTIVSWDETDIMLFGSKPPFAAVYPKKYIEPFAFKVNNTAHFRSAIRRVKELDRQGAFKRRPIAWELWSVIRHSNINHTNRNYVGINDYTCDVDDPKDVAECVEGMWIDEPEGIQIWRR